jgi:DNA-binding MarR family transcriptional regulator
VARRQAPSRPQDPAAGELSELAQRLHAAAIHLLRRLRTEDTVSGLTAPRASALSVLVFGGPMSIGQLATAEQVRPPTISRLVTELERDGLVRREADPGDARVQRVRATRAGEELLVQGRARRVARLAASLAELPAAELRALARAAPVLEGLALPAPARPRSQGRGRGRE